MLPLPSVARFPTLALGRNLSPQHSPDPVADTSVPQESCARRSLTEYVSHLFQSLVCPRSIGLVGYSRVWRNRSLRSDVSDVHCSTSAPLDDGRSSLSMMLQSGSERVDEGSVKGQK